MTFILSSVWLDIGWEKSMLANCRPNEAIELGIYCVNDKPLCVQLTCFTFIGSNGLIKFNTSASS